MLVKGGTDDVIQNGSDTIPFLPPIKYLDGLSTWLVGDTELLKWNQFWREGLEFLYEHCELIFTNYFRIWSEMIAVF